MNSLVREVFGVTVCNTASELETLVNRLENSKVEWGGEEEDAYLWAIDDLRKMEHEGKQDEPEYERLFWLVDTLGDIRYSYMTAHNEEIVADYIPSEFEIAYARLVFGDTDPGTIM